MTGQVRFRQWLGPGSMALLILGGLVLALITLLVWRTPTGTIGSTTTTWTGRSVATSAAPSASASPRARATAAPVATPATVNITTTTNTSTFQQSLPADGAIAALLGISALLVLTGVFLPRLMPSAFADARTADLQEPDMGIAGAQIASAVSARAQSRFLQGRRPRTAEELSALAAQSAAATAIALQAARGLPLPHNGVPSQASIDSIVDDAIAAVAPPAASAREDDALGSHQSTWRS